MENKRPFISVVMPVYNAEDYLENSIVCILNQTFSNLELILVNDCSKDSSKEICKKYQEKDARVKFVDLKVNGGAGNARNKGIEMAEGIYVSFVDADDKLDLDLYEKAVECSENGNIDMVVWGTTELYFNKREILDHKNIVSVKPGVWKEKEELCRQILDLESKTLFGYQWNKLYKLSVIKENHIYSEKVVLYEDFFFSLRFAEKMNSLACVPVNGYYYYKRFNESITTRYVPEYFELSRRRVQEMYEFCKTCGVTKQAKIVLGNIYMRYILSASMRNADKRSGLNGKEKTEWFANIRKDKLYEEITNIEELNSKVYKLLKSLIDNKKYFSCRILGKIVYTVKLFGPLLFARMKKVA